MGASFFRYNTAHRFSCTKENVAHDYFLESWIMYIFILTLNNTKNCVPSFMTWSWTLLSLLQARFVSDLFSTPQAVQCSSQGHQVYLQDRRLTETDSEINNTVNTVRTQIAMGAVSEWVSRLGKRQHLGSGDGSCSYFEIPFFHWQIC